MNNYNIAFFASHGGSNFQAIAERIISGEIDANAKILISNNSDSYALVRAKELGVKAMHLSSSQFEYAEDFQDYLLSILKENQIDLIVLAGYMRKIPTKIIAEFKNRIINIHPALLPKFGGQGMYGMNVHRAVIAAGESETGATVHIVNEIYDDGKILSQAKIPISQNDTPESIAEKVLKIEHILYPDTVKDIVNNKIMLD